MSIWETMHPFLHESGISEGDSRDAVCLGNGLVEVVVARDFGPRILRFGPPGTNILGRVPRAEQSVATDFGEPWHIYGGHRLWLAPEHAIHSYYPDNRPVSTTFAGGELSLVQEAHGIEKRMKIILAAHAPALEIRHSITNRSARPLRVAPWALTVMRPGGCAIFPSPELRPHPQALAPARPLVVWPYTRLNDRRLGWGDRLLRILHDRRAPAPTKLGLFNAEGWAAFAHGPDLFLKAYRPLPGEFPDYGCNTQCFTDAAILELETLGPLRTLHPGDTAHHTEHWAAGASGCEDPWTAVEGTVLIAAARLLSALHRAFPNA